LVARSVIENANVWQAKIHHFHYGCRLPISHLISIFDPVAHGPREARLHGMRRRSMLETACPQAVAATYEMASNLF
jgi:hypothetical protein